MIHHDFRMHRAGVFLFFLLLLLLLVLVIASRAIESLPLSGAEWVDRPYVKLPFNLSRLKAAVLFLCG